MEIREILTVPRSHWQNAYVERLIGSIRRDCLDHVLVFHERGLTHADPFVCSLPVALLLRNPPRTLLQVLAPPMMMSMQPFLLADGLLPLDSAAN
jgi:hypothetical protein